MKTIVRTASALLFVLGLSCQAAQAPPPAAAPKPAGTSAKGDSLKDWIEGLFAWGAGTTTLEEITSVRIPGTRIYLAKRTYTADPRMNDQTHLFVEDTGKVLIGDIFYDEERAKNPAPVRTDDDLTSMRAKVRQYLVGGFSLVLDPSSDRKNWKGVTVRSDTGYGTTPMSAFVKADDGTILVIGRFWDRSKSIPEQRREMIKLQGVPMTGPPDARVTVVEYSDMECGFCKKRTADFDALVAKLSKELKIKRYVKLFPLTGAHPWAFRAASAARCFFDLQGPESFFRFKSQVYAKQEELSVPGIDAFAIDYAYANEIPDAKFRACYLQAKSNDRVNADLTEGWALRVRSTPTYYVDGVYVSWFTDNIMEEYLRTTYLGGRGLPLPAPSPAAASSAPVH
ncbi:MAG TPA: DsbA family protein [Thermoanaerobaculia bacterium]|nr:DsbA family protein [Thermoanaerobaculia bacterium]